MAKQGIVIGLGQFGMSLARALSERGMEVLAVDRDEERVRVASTFAAKAVSFDATDTVALAETAPATRDVCVCAIGDESRESSIICTALLCQMGAPRVIARANDDLHARILSLVGAHEVVNPEREFGERFANRLVYDRIIGEMALGEDLLITEIEPPPAFVGRTLAELQLPRRYGITVIALRQAGKGADLLPDPHRPLAADDVIVVVSRGEAIAGMLERA